MTEYENSLFSIIFEETQCGFLFYRIPIGKVLSFAEFAFGRTSSQEKEPFEF